MPKRKHFKGSVASELAGWCDLPGNTTEMMRKVSAELRRLEERAGIASSVICDLSDKHEQQKARIEELEKEVKRLKVDNVKTILEIDAKGEVTVIKEPTGD